jgi:CRP-like cAMP-binding protein
MEARWFDNGDLFENGTQVELDRGETLHHSDEHCRALGRVVRGELRLSRVLSTGKEIFLRDFKAGDLFAELIVFTGEKYPGWLIASVPSLVTEVKLSQVLAYLEQHDALVSYFTGISEKMAHLSRTIEVLSLKTVRQRIAYTLLYGNLFDRGVSLSLSRLAGYIDCSREAVSRDISTMESEGLLIRVPGSLEILNRRGLEELL